MEGETTSRPLIEYLLIGCGYIFLLIGWWYLLNYLDAKYKEKYGKNRSCLIKNEENLIYITDQHTRCLHKENHSCDSPLNPFRDTTDIVKFIVNANPEKPLKIVICTNGGGLGECEQIMRFLKAHNQGYTVYCNEAYSAGTWISVSSNDLVMTSRSRISKMDFCCDGIEHVIQQRIESKGRKRTYATCFADATLNRLERLLEEYIIRPEQVKKAIKENLIYSNVIHSTKFSPEEVSLIGIKVRPPSEEEAKKYFGYFQTQCA